MIKNTDDLTSIRRKGAREYPWLQTMQKTGPDRIKDQFLDCGTAPSACEECGLPCLSFIVCRVPLCPFR